jgi:hypothetical protein
MNQARITSMIQLVGYWPNQSDGIIYTSPESFSKTILEI